MDFPASRIDKCVKDARGNFWMLTDAGIVWFDPLTSKSRVFSGNGFPEPNIFLSAMAIGREKIYVANDRRYHYFQPGDLCAGADTPKTIITGFKVLNKSMQLPAAETKLEYDRNYVSFEFTGLDFHEGGKLHYQYMMEGADKDWVDAGNRREAAYAGLPPGRYTFKVRAAGAGAWDGTPATLQLCIVAPYWQTWWFYTLCALLAAAGVYAVYLVRIDKLLALQGVRNRIARDLHDDVGSTLSSINILSAMAQNSLNDDKSKATEFVGRISASSQKMMETMSDIVWAVNPANDNMQHIIAHMRQYLASVLEPQHIDFTFDVGSGITQAKIDIDKRRDFYLVFKEAVNNIAKYAACTQVKITMVISGHGLRLVITDNGKGFDTGNAKRGNGLANMHTRAAALGGHLIIESSAGVGTTLSLVFPIR